MSTVDMIARLIDYWRKIQQQWQSYAQLNSVDSRSCEQAGLWLRHLRLCFPCSRKIGQSKIQHSVWVSRSTGWGLHSSEPATISATVSWLNMLVLFTSSEGKESQRKCERIHWRLLRTSSGHRQAQSWARAYLDLRELQPRRACSLRLLLSGICRRSNNQRKSS